MRETPSIRPGRARASGDLVVSAAVVDLPALFERAVAGSRQFKIDKTRPERVELYRPTNWLTWGETLIADFSRVDAAHTLVTVHSRPTFALQLQDWGQSRNDVAALLDAVSAVASGTASPLANDAPVADLGAARTGNKLTRLSPVALCLIAAATSVALGTLLLGQH